MAPTRTNIDSAESQDNSLAKRSRHLTHFVDMFWNPANLLSHAKKLERMSANDELAFREDATDKLRRLLALVDKFKELEPEAFAQLSKAGSAGPAIWYAKKRLSEGQSNSKLEDMRKVREVLVTCTLNLKSERGLNHPQCAFYLSPTKVDWDNPEAVTQFILYQNPPMDPSLWPCYLWHENKFNPNQKSEGLLRNEFLIKAARAILFSPAASKTVTTMQVVGVQGHSINTAFIAYVAVVVRHSLTSDETFGDVCTGFSYIEYYNQIREFLERPGYQPWTALLLEYWNEQLFSGYCASHQVAGSSHYRNTGTLAELTAELAADAEDAREQDEEQSEK
ncbi:hypothetical protein BDV93DRAFT_513858 [Ceratobasidium sp. AG-I]|nr:hypothetical protein BDV93DRAFT_513858 [Ceratobasidium sp. AG-I]